jgi:ribosomal 50S subunit-associated protein YjgA (DUF615 family)
MEQKRISADELAMRLVNSKKIMQKVDTGDYEKGNINEEFLSSPESNSVIDDEPQPSKSTLKQSASKLKATAINPEKINQSKLPDAIKQSMIEHPIPQISLNDSLDMDFVQKAKNLMERDGTLTNASKSAKSVQQLNLTKLEKKLTTIIENVIRKVLDEKLTQILTAQQLGTINENLVLKVGDSIFQGKITGVKNTKSNK